MPPALLTLQDSALFPDQSGASLSELWGRKAGGEGGERETCSRGRKGPGRQFGNALEYSGPKTSQERGLVMEEKSSFNFPQEKNERQNNFPGCRPK